MQLPRLGRHPGFGLHGYQVVPVTTATALVRRSIQSQSMRVRMPMHAVCHSDWVGAAITAGEPGGPIAAGALSV